MMGMLLLLSMPITGGEGAWQWPALPPWGGERAHAGLRQRPGARLRPQGWGASIRPPAWARGRGQGGRPLTRPRRTHARTKRHGGRMYERRGGRSLPRQSDIASGN